MKFCLLLILLPFCLWGVDINWQADQQAPFKLIIKIYPKELAIGDSLNVKVELSYPLSYWLNTDALVNQLLWSANPLAPKWRLLQFESSILNTNESLQTQHINIKLFPLSAGEITLSFLTVSLLSKEAVQSPLHILTPIFAVNVLQSSSVALDSSSFAPVIPLEPQFPLELTQANRELFIDNPEQLEKTKKIIQDYLEKHSFPWLILIILLICGGFGWILYLTRKRWFKYSATPIVEISPRQQIDRALQILQKWQFDQEKIQIYYVELGSVLLNALQIRLDWKKQEFTTFEVAEALKKQTLLSSYQVNELLSFLAKIDQVKFAGKNPLQSEAVQLLQQIQTFIQQLFLV